MRSLEPLECARVSSLPLSWSGSECRPRPPFSIVRRSGGAVIQLLVPLLVGLLFRGDVLPPADRGTDREDFLSRAQIVDGVDLEVGVTGSRRITLRQGDVEHDAHLQTVDRVYSPFHTTDRSYHIFRDSYRYNIAAWRLDRLLGLGMVPVSVERRVGGKPAAVTWWVDEVAMMEADRIRAGIRPPDLVSWRRQMARAQLFDLLVYNADFNPTNLLITESWGLWMIDFTRAFRIGTGNLPVGPEELPSIGPRLQRALRELDSDLLARELRPYLSRSELRSLERRRRVLVEMYAGIRRQQES